MNKQLQETNKMMNDVKKFSSLMNKEHQLSKKVFSLQHSLVELEGNTSNTEVAAIKVSLDYLYKELSMVQNELNSLEKVI